MLEARSLRVASRTLHLSADVHGTDQAHIFKVDTKGELTVFRENSHGANGLLVDPQGRLVACEGALGGEPPRITRTDLRTGTIEILADGYEGMPFKGTNDVTIDNKGRLYFTDPAGAALYRIDGPGQTVRVLAAPDIRRPNGLQISPDDKTLYVIESGNPSSEPRMIRAFDLRPDGTASRGRTLFDFRRPRQGRRQRRRPGKPLHRGRTRPPAAARCVGWRSRVACRSA